MEHRLSGIAAEIVVTAELTYREGCLREYEWRLQRRPKGRRSFNKAESCLFWILALSEVT